MPTLKELIGKSSVLTSDSYTFHVDKHGHGVYELRRPGCHFQSLKDLVVIFPTFPKVSIEEKDLHSIIESLPSEDEGYGTGEAPRVVVRSDTDGFTCYFNSGGKIAVEKRLLEKLDNLFVLRPVMDHQVLTTEFFDFHLDFKFKSITTIPPFSTPYDAFDAYTANVDYLWDTPLSGLIEISIEDLKQEVLEPLRKHFAVGAILFSEVVLRWKEGRTVLSQEEFFMKELADTSLRRYFKNVYDLVKVDSNTGYFIRKSEEVEGEPVGDSCIKLIQDPKNGEIRMEAMRWPDSMVKELLTELNVTTASCDRLVEIDNEREADRRHTGGSVREVGIGTTSFMHLRNGIALVKLPQGYYVDVL